MQPPGLCDLFNQLYSIKKQLQSLSSQVDHFTVSIGELFTDQTDQNINCSCQQTDLSLSPRTDTTPFDLTNCSVPLDLTNYSTKGQILEDYLGDVNVVTTNREIVSTVSLSVTAPEIITIDEECCDDQSSVPTVIQPQPRVTLTDPNVPTASKRVSEETIKTVCKRAKKCHIVATVEPTKPHQNNEEHSTVLEQAEQTPDIPVCSPSTDPGTQSEPTNDSSAFISFISPKESSNLDPIFSSQNESISTEQINPKSNPTLVTTISDNASIKPTSPTSGRSSRSNRSDRASTSLSRPISSHSSQNLTSQQSPPSSRKIFQECDYRLYDEHIKTISLKCPIDDCQDSFECETDLSSHALQKHKQNLFKCPVRKCSESFTDRKTMSLHCDKHYPDITCRSCRTERYFKTTAHLINHIKQRHTRGHFCCIKEANCSFTGKYRIDVIRHIRTVHKKASSSVAKFKIIEMKCPQETCDERFTEEEMDRYYEHMFHHHDISPNRCLVNNCSRSYPTEQELTNHLSTRHANLSVWQCRHCPQKENTYSHLKRHIFTVHYEGLFQCSKEKCNFRSTFRSTVINHFNKEHL